MGDLQSALTGLIEAAEVEPEQNQAASATQRETGSIELKWIKRNGKPYGPYRYLRYWGMAPIRVKMGHIS